MMVIHGRVQNVFASIQRREAGKTACGQGAATAQKLECHRRVFNECF